MCIENNLQFHNNVHRRIDMSNNSLNTINYINIPYMPSNSTCPKE